MGAATSPSETRKGAERRKRIVAFVVAYHQQHGTAPTKMAIGRAIGIESTTMGLVSWHLIRLSRTDSDCVLARDIMENAPKTVRHRSKSLMGTERCNRIVAFVGSYHEANRRPPSFKEIGKEIGVTSSSLVSYYLNRLEADGVISRLYNSARSVLLTQAPA